jgi:hypothetical protein
LARASFSPPRGELRARQTSSSPPDFDLAVHADVPVTSANPNICFSRFAALIAGFSIPAMTK